MKKLKKTDNKDNNAWSSKYTIFSTTTRGLLRLLTST